MKINKFNNFHAYIVIVVILIGVALRGVEVASKNYLFGFDQGNDYIAASKIVEEGKLRLIGAEIGLGSAGINGIFQGPFYYYILAVIYWIFHGDPYGSIILMFLIGVITLISSYFIFSKIFNFRISILILLLVSISPPIISQSRFLWAPHPSTILIILSLFFLYKSQKRPRLYFPLSVFFASYTYNFEIAVTPPLLISIFISNYFIYRIKDLKTYLFGIAAFFITISPAIIFEFRHGFMAIRSGYDYILGSQDGTRGISIISLNKHILYYYYNLKNTFFHNSSFLSDFWKILVLAIVFLPSFFFAGSRKPSLHKDILKSNVFTVFITWLFFLFLNNTIWNHYLIHLHIAYILIFSLTFNQCLENYRKFVIFKFLTSVNILFLVILLAGSFQRLYRDYFYDYFDHGGPLKIRGKMELVDYVYEDANYKKFNVLIFTPPVYTYAYDYMFQWYGRKKYGYQPGKSEKGLTYLLIEPDSEKPWSYEGWIQTVLHPASTIWNLTLPNGFIVQKRIYD